MPSITKTDVYKHKISQKLYRDAADAYMKDGAVPGVKDLLFKIAMAFADRKQPGIDPSVYLSDAEMKRAQKAVADCPTWTKKLSGFKVQTGPTLFNFGDHIAIDWSNTSNPIGMVIAHGIAHSGFEGKELAIPKTLGKKVHKVELIEEPTAWFIRVYVKG